MIQIMLASYTQARRKCVESLGSGLHPLFMDVRKRVTCKIVVYAACSERSLRFVPVNIAVSGCRLRVD